MDFMILIPILNHFIPSLHHYPFKLHPVPHAAWQLYHASVKHSQLARLPSHVDTSGQWLPGYPAKHLSFLGACRPWWGPSKKTRGLQILSSGMTLVFIKWSYHCNHCCIFLLLVGSMSSKNSTPGAQNNAGNQIDLKSSSWTPTWLQFLTVCCWAYITFKLPTPHGASATSERMGKFLPPQKKTSHSEVVEI